VAALVQRVLQSALATEAALTRPGLPKHAVRANASARDPAPAPAPASEIMPWSLY
jgi:hypothetical protein